VEADECFPFLFDSDLRLHSLALGRQRLKKTGGVSFSEIFSSRVTRLQSEATSDTAR